jgi:hypothetical protein
MVMNLTVELVPETSWYNNMRKFMSPEDWDVLRRKTYKKFEYKCAICGATNTTMNCHEIWEYDDHNHIQYLKGFTSLCTMCHHVKHLGLAEILASKGELDIDTVINHALRVNKMSMSEWDKYESAVWEKWEERSHHSWKVDFGEYKGLITEGM